MGRHSSGKNNYSLSVGAIVGIVVVIALIIAGVWWLLGRDGGEPAAQKARECTLVPIAAADEKLAETIVAGWSNPEGEDCVEAEYTDDLAAAAVYVGPDSPAVDKLLAESGREVTGEMKPVASVAVGLAGDKKAVVDEVDPQQVSFDTKAQPEASVLAADALGVEKFSTDAGEFAATAETQAEGKEFTPLDGVELVHFARTLAPSGDVSEQQADAAGSAVATAAESYEGPSSSPKVSDKLWAALEGQAPEEKAPEETPEAAKSAADITLFLVDTSAASAPFFDKAAAAVGDAAVAATQDGKKVALWNYSSPLNPGVTQGWRQNITYTEVGEDVRQSVQQFGLGGVPQTRSALAAALANVNEVGGTGRVVLLTTGTADPLAQLPELPEGVELSVIHLGEGEVDADLAKLATNHVHVVDPDALATTVGKDRKSVV